MDSNVSVEQETRKHQRDITSHQREIRKHQWEISKQPETLK